MLWFRSNPLVGFDTYPSKSIQTPNNTTSLNTTPGMGGCRSAGVTQDITSTNAAMKSSTSLS
ncbi:MAG: hypothetical protein EZS28_048141, partial [Streblomastix strix]